MKGDGRLIEAAEKEVRNTFRRFMALNPDKWDWQTAKVPSPLTKEMEESQSAKQVTDAMRCVIFCFSSNYCHYIA